MRGDIVEAGRCPTCQARPTHIKVAREYTTTAPGKDTPRTYLVQWGWCTTPGCGRWHLARTITGEAPAPSQAVEALAAQLAAAGKRRTPRRVVTAPAQAALL
jgi:hypothetical protein